MKRPLVFAALPLLLAACGKQHDNRTETLVPEHITQLNNLPGTPCGSALMVVITRQDGSTFCIDRFEAKLDNGAPGNAVQSSNDESLDLDGSTEAAAQGALGVKPATSVSWYQAKAACANTGKRLCSAAEWERACRGPEGIIYPYGDDMNDAACRGFFNYPAQRPSNTGSLKTCGSAFGVYDLSGNVEEWTATAVERIPGSGILNDRAVRGGSFKSNVNALACVGVEFHEAPGSTDTDRGFRCCQDAP